MCGIAGLAGPIAGGEAGAARLERMLTRQHHRGPDDRGHWAAGEVPLRLGHNRLAILDRSAAGHQPMAGAGGRFVLSFNGEIYNYRELRDALGGDAHFRTGTDSEVLLAAWARWGPDCLDRLVGMFAFLIWDTATSTLFAVRDRFGVKPLFVHHRADGSLAIASEVATLHAAGVAAEPDEGAWARYLARGVHDEGTRTFWRHIERLPAGCLLTWRDGEVATRRWYDLTARWSTLPAPAAEDHSVAEAYQALLEESVRLRFRADVPVGINLSGGLDSSTLLALVHAVQGADSAVRAFTFVCDDPGYDELPWVETMLAGTQHPLEVAHLTPDDVPSLATSVTDHQSEPFGGLPTLAYARLFEVARERGTIVLLDGQGMDEQWAGYDYYRHHEHARTASEATVQGTRERPVRPECLLPEMQALGAVGHEAPQTAGATGDALVDLQLRDLLRTKLPRALRFNDRVSMRASCELREPFLDHRLVELALRQPAARKISDTTGKVLLRRIAADLVPDGLVEAPKRPLQTPQREWLRGPLRDWVEASVDTALNRWSGAWLDGPATRTSLAEFLAGRGDNSFFVWQWISLGLLAEQVRTAPIAEVAS